MSFGLPTIGFADCPGTNELFLNGENGVIVERPDHIPVFADALEKLMTSTELRVKYGTKAKQIIDHFHPDKIIGAWENLIGEVVQKG